MSLHPVRSGRRGFRADVGAGGSRRSCAVMWCARSLDGSATPATPSRKIPDMRCGTCETAFGAPDAQQGRTPIGAPHRLDRGVPGRTQRTEHRGLKPRRSDHQIPPLLATGIRGRGTEASWEVPVSGPQRLGHRDSRYSGGQARGRPRQPVGDGGGTAATGSGCLTVVTT